MSFGFPISSGAGSSDGGSRGMVAAAQYLPRPSSARSISRSSGLSSKSCGSDNTKWEMSLDEFKRQVQNQFTVVLSWDEVRALQKLYGEPGSGTIDFMKFAVALGKSPGHGLDKTRQAYNFLPKNATDYDLRAIEEKIVHKLEDRCEVAGNYQYQWARRMLCDPASTIAGGMQKTQLKRRLSGLLGVELSDREIEVLFQKYADPATGRVHMQAFATRLLAPDRKSGWFFLENQLVEPVVTNRISPSARYHNRHGVETYDPMDNVFPQSLKGFKWDIEKLVAKLKLKLHEQAQGIAGYQFLAGCNLFRHEVPNRKGDRISAEDFRRAVEYKFGMKVDPDEVLALFHFLVPGTGEAIEIAEMVRVLMPNDYTNSWFSTRESTDMFGFTKAAPDKVVLQANKMNVGGSWNLSLIENKIREKIHERVGGTGVFEVQAAYTLFLDGRNTGLTKAGFKTKMHDKFAVVLRDKDVDDVFAKYDPKGTGSLDVHKFVVQLISPPAEPEPWFRDRATYEFHVLNRAPMKKDPMKAECWRKTRWTFREFEDTIRGKLVAKSNQDGGRFAFKSAVNLLRSANPDHLDSSNMDRDALKFVVFRRFDVVMDDHLLDEVFARFDPERTGKVSVHRIVQSLLPSRHDGSHHLVPKTEEQGQATRTLLGKIFGMTGKRREMISLNGSGVDDPQAQSLLERMAAGDKGDGEKIKASLARKANAAATSAAAKEIAAVEAARSAPKENPEALAARCRDNSPLIFSGDVVAPDTAVTRKVARSEAVSSKGSGSGSGEPGRGGRHPSKIGNVADGVGKPPDGGTHRAHKVSESGTRQGSAQGSDLLRERERVLDAREGELRKREDAANRRGFATTTSRSTGEGQKHAAASGRAAATTVSGHTQPQSSRPARERPASATARQPQNGQAQKLRGASMSYIASGGGSGRPQSAGSRRSIQSRAGEEANLIARCRALGATRRKAATQRQQATASRLPSQPKTHEHRRSESVVASRDDAVTGIKSGKPPKVPVPTPNEPHRAVGAKRKETKTRDRIGGEFSLPSHPTIARKDDDGKVTELRPGGAVAARIPSRPQSAKAASRGERYSRPRPRSATTLRSRGGKSDGFDGKRVFGSGTGNKGLGNFESRPDSEDHEDYCGKGPAHGSSSPTSGNATVSDRGKRYRRRLDSAYALQMQAMRRLQRRTDSSKPTPERPASGGCEGVSTGQFRSRYSGLDRFVLMRGMDQGRERPIQPGASRYGGGVPYFGC